MPDIEIRIATALAQVKHIANQTTGEVHSSSAVIGGSRNIIDGMRIGIVQIKLNVIGHALMQCHQQGVITGEALIGDVYIGTELRRQSNAVCKSGQPEEGKCHKLLHKIREVAALHEPGSILRNKLSIASWIRRRDLVFKERFGSYRISERIDAGAQL